MIENLVGSPARDGQWDPPPQCSVCATTDQQVIDRVERSMLRSVPRRPAGSSRLVCQSCLEAALKSLGPGVRSLQVRACVGSGDHEPDRFAVAAIFPFRSFAGGPHWLGCTGHVNDALDLLATELSEGTA